MSGLIVQPDVEAFVWARLKLLGPGVTSFSFTALEDFPGWQWRYGIQVDCRAKRKAAARALAEQARQTMSTLDAAAWADGVITYIQATEGPFWLPDDDGCPRYCTRWEIRCHPTGLSPSDPV